MLIISPSLCLCFHILKQNFTFYHTFYLFIHLSVCLCVVENGICVPQHTCESQRAVCRSPFFFPIMWDLEIKLRFLDLALDRLSNLIGCASSFISIIVIINNIYEYYNIEYKLYSNIIIILIII